MLLRCLGASVRRFEAGAFSDVGNLDAILNVQHDRGKAIARTGGGGLTLTDSAASLELRAELDPEDIDAKRALSKVQKKILRGLSIEFMPLKDRMEGTREGGYTQLLLRRQSCAGLPFVIGQPTPAAPYANSRNDTNRE